ncbi:hypothetical protein JGI3_00903 [Candidatus Kryptobacter tengchongensis]|uniref:Uncharacterized protein n=1 Tax=Kryptobacter tengchongensis TaxID=1643429 RepID=A0A656D116_KRYT1|nr:hypothetical protein [Candidatus Kryptobacter tengchongensis]CUS96314.1 hypothetical protein JGI24_00087 [Candidatus Kryptobacter tengchongensis]CUU04165.1 hypothetical protein JGI3_00903 [Candidatus Kryptobacter tengchongensis]
MVGLIGIAVIVLIVIFAIFYGYGLILKQERSSNPFNLKVKCTLCGRFFDKENLVERAIGIEKLYYFCGDCIKSLYTEHLNKKQN